MVKTYREGRCALCYKERGHLIHDARPPLRWWQRLLRLTWPTFIHGDVAGVHHFVERDRHVQVAEEMFKLRQRRTTHTHGETR